LEDNLQMTKQEIVNLQKDFEELKATLIKESFKQQSEDSNNNSFLDMSQENGSGQKARGRRGLSGEFFFGDHFILYVEQLLNEGQLLSPTPSDASSEKMTLLRDWGLQSLRAKHRYLTELRKLQQNYIEGLITEALRFVDKKLAEQAIKFGKNYIQNELGKNELVANRIGEALKKYDNSEASSPETQKGVFNYDFNGNEKTPLRTYEEILNRIEQKYEEVRKLASLGPKSRESSTPSEPSVICEFFY